MKCSSITKKRYQMSATYMLDYYTISCTLLQGTTIVRLEDQDHTDFSKTLQYLNSQDGKVC